MTARIEESVSIPQDPNRVWPLLADPAAWPRWIEGLQSAESAPPGALGDGSSVRIAPVKGPAVEARVVHHVPRQAIELEARGLPMDLDVRVEIRLSPEGSGSRVSITMSTELNGMLIFAEKLVVAKGSAALRRWLDRLLQTAG